MAAYANNTTAPKSTDHAANNPTSTTILTVHAPCTDAGCKAAAVKLQ